MKFLTFAHTKIDSFLQMELLDLARSLSRDKKLKVEFSYHSYCNRTGGVIHVSQFWMPYADEIARPGLKSDVYLRAFGSYYYSDAAAISNALDEIKGSEHANFLKHLLLLFEDIRLEALCVANRPGMKAAFEVRRKTLATHYQRQFKQHVVQKRQLDALFCFLFARVYRRLLSLETLAPLFHELAPFLQKLHEASSTSEMVHVLPEISQRLKQAGVKDMETSYLSFHESQPTDETWKDLLREDDLQSVRPDDTTHEASEEGTVREEMPSWHEETSSPHESFLQFDLEQGTATDLLGEGERQAESGDQAYGAVQSGTQTKKGNNFDQQDAASNEQGKPALGEQPIFRYGELNRYATFKEREPVTPSLEEVVTYRELKKDIQPSVHRLQQSFLKTLQHKKNTPMSDLHFGRLSQKKLTTLITEKNPRLFYKVAESPKELDAVFTLLVDCSASMFDKMEETHKAIVLFHETLKAVSLPHSVIGFWEDAADATKEEQPNYFQEVLSFTSSTQSQAGPEILQLEPQEDNRDGYAIRKAAEALLRRSEKQKFLLVFSDGEPAAFDYEDHGVRDTHEAVMETRKKGIETLGMYIANGHVTEEENQLMRNIYGNHQVVVPSASELVSYLVPILRRLLFALSI
ncbi:von Willebrand factor A [Fictibacillus macauensis ZFHKF-1]|uniref:von Willebrand factor A n=1 Tax=Fictibacillus macauensis ZFHKF-1 TaxID=1196324 RepID=I8UIY1_9BACL|nr:VWA domain-containing protein [Fictibacillus macauensis]EIT86788.1 von Willebrand factor A [Fictibacillus macauensis ZFHKF-1]